MKITKQENKAMFIENYVQYPWFESDRRPKTFQAIKTLFDRMPSRWQEKIPNITIYAPSPTLWGEILPWHTPANLPVAMKTFFIYLSPELEKRPQVWVNATVAHEMAHAVLGHGEHASARDARKGGSYWKEKAADELIEKWGYHATNSCGWKSHERRRTRKAKAAK